MARYADDSKEKVRDAVDFLDLVGSRVELRKAGARRWEGLCPFHDERSPSFGIDPVEKLYHCFGCGAGGDVFRWVMDLEGVGFVEALELLADRYNVPLERVEEDPQAAQRRERRARLHALLERTAAYYVRLLWESAEAEGARAYLASRGLDEPTAREFRVGYAPAAWDRVVAGSARAGYSEAELLAAGLALRKRSGQGLIDRFRGRLMFPWADARGRVLGFGARALSADDQPKYLNSPEGDVFHKGRLLYGTHLARGEAAKAGAVVLVEGYTDVLALHQAGIRHVVGQMGTALTAEQAGELARLAPTLLLCLDADAAGRQAMLKAADVARGGGRRLELRVVPLPAGSDPADVVQRDGPEAVRGLLDGALPFARWQVEHALASGDTGTAEGRDRLLAEVGPVVRALPPSVLREELVQLVAGRLGLSEGLVAAALGDGGTARAAFTPPRSGRGPNGDGRGRGPAGGARGRERDRREPGPDDEDAALAALIAADPGREGEPRFDDPGPAAPARGGASGAVLQALEHRSEIEHAFLALCIALPDAGAARLAELDLDAAFSSPVARRAAAHVRDHAAAPSTGLPEDDDALAALVAQLVVRAAGYDAPAAPELDRAALMLDLARLDREIAAARAHEAPVSDLAAERQRVLAEIRRITR